jgi:predicted DNA-binding protein with PD1-like motif
MKYSTGKIGRAIVARFDHGDDLLEALNALCVNENIYSGWILLFGALARGDVVLGPEEEELPPNPVMKEVSQPHEVVGTGTIAGMEGAPSIHLHGSFGSKDGVITGCLRNRGEVYIVIECLILELEGVNLVREKDEKTGLHLIGFPG